LQRLVPQKQNEKLGKGLVKRRKMKKPAEALEEEEP